MLSMQQSVQLLQQGKVEKAIEGFSQRLSIDSKDVDANQLIGVSYIMTSDYKLAENTC
jgi:hypothetical protein